jgi:hypothetical protein
MIRKASLAALIAAAILLFGIHSATAGSTPPDSALHSIARIMITLNHFPSDKEKRELQAIIDSETATDGERTLASALMAMEHQVSRSDRGKLQQLKDDEAADGIERDLADILMNMNHQPSSRDRDRLRRYL